jgi:hypothetical protein
MRESAFARRHVMKQVCLSVGVVLCLFLCAGAQSLTGAKKDKFDLFLSTGYGFKLGGRSVGASTTRNAGPPGQNPLLMKEDHFMDYGRGIKVEGGASYKLIERLYGQLALCYSFGVPGITKKVEVIGDYAQTEKYSFSMFGVKALVKPMFRVFDILDMYTNFGIGLFFGYSSAEITRIGTNAYTQKAEDSNAPALGYVGAIGVEYPINESVILYGDIYGEMVSFTMKKTEYSASTGTESDNVQYYQEDVTDRTTPPKTPGTNLAIRAGVRFPIF